MTVLFRRPTLNPRQVPTVPVEVDFSHPLGANLIGLYIPGLGGTDLCGNGPPIFPQANTSFTTSAHGPGASSLMNTSGMASTAIPTRFQRVNTNMGLVHVGWHTSTATGATAESCLFGLTFSGATYLPFTITTNNTQFHFCNNNGANFATFSLAAGSPTLGLNIVAVTNSTAGVANSFYAYKNGVNTLSAGSTGVGAVNWSGGPNCKVDMCYSQWTPGTLWMNCISLAGMIYDWGPSPMPANLAAWQGVEPFAMLRPIVRRTYSMPSVVSTTQAQMTQVGLEQWAQGTARAQATQVAAEMWASVSTISQTVRTYPITGTRAGLSGTVAETQTRTYTVAMPAVLTEGYVTPAVPPSTQGVRVMIMA